MDYLKKKIASKKNTKEITNKYGKWWKQYI